MIRAKTSVFLAWIFFAVALNAMAPNPASAARGAADTLADFEGPATPPEFFVFSGGSTVTAAAIAVADSDPLAIPGQVGNNGVLQVDYDVFDFGGFGQAFELAGPQDWSNYTSFDFWFYGTGSGLIYQVEISDNRSDPGLDTSERFDYALTDTTPGWQYISIPFDDFTRATDFQPGGAPDDGFTLTEIWAWSIVLPGGADTAFIDDVSLGLRVIDDFEAGLPAGVDGNGVPVGFFTFQDGSSAIAVSAPSTPPAPVLPAAGEPNNVLQVDVDVAVFAGVVHNFENDALNTWVPQDWSSYSGFSFWFYGSGSGTQLFIDLIENRNAGSTTDDAERWTVNFVDDFTGWQRFEFPFADFTRKEIGNGAPNDGLTLQSVHGWAFGTLATNGPRVYYIDNVALFGIADVPPLSVTFASRNYGIEEGTTGEILVALNRPMNEEDPAQVFVDYATEAATSIATEGRDYAATSGTLTFVNGGPSAQTFPIQTFDDTKYEGNERIALRLSNPIGVEPGFDMQASGFVVDNDPFDPNLLDDFEKGAFLWRADNGIVLSTPEIGAGDLLARPGQDAYERILNASTPIAVDTVVAGNLCKRGNGVVPVVILTTDDFDATTVDHTTVRFGNALETHSSDGDVQRHEEDFEGDGDVDLVFHFRVNETGYDCRTAETVLTGATFGGQAIGAGGNPGFGRDFAIGQDWSRGEALRFWFYGTGSGDEIGITLKDNRAADPGPAGWSLAWSDEFNEPAGAPPKATNWSFELGDVDRNGNRGWGNQELQYYSDDPANAATDGAGNLALTLRQADGSLECFYGSCEYTSARLISQNKAEFAYGRIESRLKVPQGTGIWPAFWSLGTDFDRVGWPQTGEIDFMEFVGRLPNEIFGAIHGPGYSGGASFGGIFDFGGPVYNEFHTFTVEWQPDLIEWYVDGNLYHSATPADVAPNEWVFNDPVFLLLNVAVGGNFGGAVGPDLMPPQSLLVDYVRVYQAPDTAERFEASFVDNFSGWQEVVIPFSAFTRSDEQPAGAPNDGLGLSDVWGYGVSLPDGGTTQGSLRLDLVRLQPVPPPTEITIVSLNDSGDGSLRQALEDIAIGGTISIDPSLAGGTIFLTSGPLVPGGDVTIDASAAPGLSINGGGSNRVLIVEAGLNVTVSNLTVTNGFGFQLAGGILNNGNLTLDHVAVTGNLMTTDAGDFWQGGGGIYNGGGSTLSLIDSTVADNVSGWTGGGVYSFFGTNVVVERSTISGNVAMDVGGGFRGLGDLFIVNSTVTGNTSTTWHGGGGFFTDGVTDVLNSTIIDNVAPAGTAGGFFVGTFGDAAATLNVTNSILASGANLNCFLAPFGAGPVALNSGGNNVVTDASCNPAATDQIVADPGTGPLQDNGGPTSTHALQPGSPAIDAANPALCPPTDQRGVARDAACDAGAFELQP